MENEFAPNMTRLLDEVAGQVTGEHIDSPSRFTFIWHNIKFSGQILPSSLTNQFTLNLVANLGHIPFSSEDNHRRQKLLKLFTPHFMKGDYSLSLGSQVQTVLLTKFTGPLNAKRLLEVITVTICDLQKELKAIQTSMFA